MTTRRRFMQQAAAAAAGTLGSRVFAHDMGLTAPPSIPNLDPNSLARFVDRLPLPPVAQPIGTAVAPNSGEPVPQYRVPMRAAAVKLHRDLPPTRVWTYGGSFPGLTFETRRGKGLMVEWANELPMTHFLPIDHSLHGAGREAPEVRGVVHLHGGKSPPESDGYPEDWYVPGQSRNYHYPNAQDATLLWYHDHAMGINRLNIYAGMFGLHVIRDDAEDALHLPSGKYEVPLILCDRDVKRDGQLSYPVSPDPERPWVPECFGDLHLVNGKITPFLEVEPRKYRFRILNAANGRFYSLSLSDGAQIHQIGSDQGLLAAPLALPYVHLAPGERADIVIDFSQHRGANIILQSDALQLLQFRVGKPRVSDSSLLPARLRDVPRLAESNAVRTRRLTLDEKLNLVQESRGMLLNNTPWHAPITEKPELGSTEIWELVNLTDDVHPIHLHMVRFQILDRRRFDAFDYMQKGLLRYVDAPTAAEPNEQGWKDTARVNTHTVTRIIVPFVGFAGRFVWHCHILEHEDNEMMRPFEVVSPVG